MDTLKNFITIHQILFISIFLFIFNVSFSQSSPSNTAAYSLEFVNGVSLPLGDLKTYSEKGLNSTLTINKKFCDKVSLGLTTNYTALPITNKYGSSNKQWNSTSINVGPQYHIGTSKFSVQCYGKIGLSFVSIPEIQNFYDNTDIIITNFEKTTATTLNTRVGINLGTEICKGLYFYVASEYSYNPNGNINYGIRDISKAIDATGNIDPDLASTICFKNQNFSFSSFNVDFGIRIDLKGNNNTRATDYNSSRSNRSTSVISPDDSNNNDGDNNDTKATDYNSSRSNRSTSVISPDGSNNNDENNNGTRATDYNSSRSNKNTSGVSSDINDDTESNNTKAQDYNSSRSNNESSDK